MTDSFQIRRANTADFDDLNQLLALLGYEIDEQEIAMRKKIFEEILFSEHQRIFVVVSAKEKKVQAMITCSILPQLRLAGHKMEIDELVVSPERRGDGIGSELVNYIIAEARLMCVKNIIISNNRERESFKRSFYIKLGFDEKNSSFFNYTL